MSAPRGGPDVKSASLCSTVQGVNRRARGASSGSSEGPVRHRTGAVTSLDPIREDRTLAHTSPRPTDLDRASGVAKAWARWRRPVVVALVGTVGFRLIVGWVSLVSAYGTKFPHVIARHPAVLTNVLSHWDALYYLTNAAHGYPSASRVPRVESARLRLYAFGPFFEGLIRLTHEITRTSYATSAELDSVLGLFLAIVGLWKLVAIDAGSEAADAATVLLLAWPSAFFLVSPYPESVTLAAAVWAFLAVRRGHFLAAGLLAAAGSLSKFYLVLLVIPLVMEMWSARSMPSRWHMSGVSSRFSSPKTLITARIAAIAAPTIAVMAGWIAYQQVHFGNGFAFIRSQAEWGRHVSWPWTSLVKAFSDLFDLRILGSSTATVVELFDLVTVIMLGVAAVYAYLHIRPSYGVLLGCVWCAFTFQTLLLSESREVLVLFPFFGALGVFVARHAWRERILLFLFLPAGYFLLERFVTGRFAG